MVTNETLIVTLTLGQLKEALSLPPIEKEKTESTSTKKMVHGLRGIRQLFGISHVTAQRYKNTFLAPAIMQHGRKIMVDVEMALKLFAENNPVQRGGKNGKR